MKLLSIEGTFQNGKIDLTDLHAGFERSKVIVIFLQPTSASPEANAIRFGELASPELVAAGRYSTEEDFKCAEYHGDKEWDLDDGK